MHLCLHSLGSKGPRRRSSKSGHPHGLRCRLTQHMAAAKACPIVIGVEVSWSLSSIPEYPTRCDVDDTWLRSWESSEKEPDSGVLWDFRAKLRLDDRYWFVLTIVHSHACCAFQSQHRTDVRALENEGNGGRRRQGQVTFLVLRHRTNVRANDRLLAYHDLSIHSHLFSVRPFLYVYFNVLSNKCWWNSYCDDV